MQAELDFVSAVLRNPPAEAAELPHTSASY